MTTLNTIKKHCHSAGIALTPLREEVLALIYASHKPLGAYELLRELQKSRPNAAPPTIYRTLDFLLEQHLIHRIDANNTFTACSHPTDQHQGQFLLCTACGKAIEIEDAEITKAIHACAKQHRFTINHLPTEIRGICAQCQ